MVTLRRYKKYIDFSLDEFQDYQLKKLKAFTQNTIKHSAYYRKKVSKHTRINSYDEFQKLPLLEQRHLRKKTLDELRATSWKEITSVTRSSGSSGKSKIVLWTRNAIKEEIKWGSLGYLIQGIKPTTRFALIMPLEMSRIPSILTACENIGAFSIPIGRIRTDIDTDNAIELIRKTKATLINASPSRLESITKRVEELGLNPKKDFQVSQLNTGGMIITKELKQYLQTRWNAELFEVAGANEFSFIGFECSQHNGLHILPGANYIEVINPKTHKTITDGKTIGEVLITGFSNLGTSLLRYRIGDTGVINYNICGCGLSFPRLFIKGRTMGTISLGGTKIYAYQINEALGKIPYITPNYQVIVKNKDGVDIIKIKIECHKPTNVSESKRQKIIDTLQKDPSTVYEIYDKIIAGKVKFDVDLLEVGVLERSAGDKIKDQFIDKRTN